MAVTARFWDRHAAGYAKRPVANEDAYRRKLQITRDYLTPETEVLEFGCGTGSTAIAHAPYVKRILATDISARMLEIASGKAATAGLQNVSFEQSTLEGLGLPDASFDVVMGHSILHLLEDMDGALAEVHRILKPGGYFISSTACIAGSMAWFRYIAPVGRFLGLLPYVSIFSRQFLENSLTRADFALDHVWQPDGGTAVFIVAQKDS